MIGAVSTRRSVLVPTPAVDLLDVPPQIMRRAQAADLQDCDVCGWPVHPVVVVTGRRPRHPGCMCCVCEAPLQAGELMPGVTWHPRCRTVRAARPVLVASRGTR